MENLFEMFFYLYCLYTSYQTFKQFYKITKRYRGTKRMWTRANNTDRNTKGYFVTVFQKIKQLDQEEFFSHTRMNKKQYDILLNLIKSRLTKSTLRRPPIDFECRLALTIS